MVYRPHGIVGVGACCTVGSSGSKFTEVFPGLTRFCATLDLHFKFPIRAYSAEALGFIPCSFEYIVQNLSKPDGGNALFLVVGGAQEALECHENVFRLCLKTRKGFCRAALISGAQLVPVFAFGENKTFKTAHNPVGSNLRSFQEFTKNIIGFSPMVFYGTSGIPGIPGPFPLRQRLDVVFGAPIPVEKTENPSKEQINVLHQLYMDQLVELFEKNKTLYGVSKDSKIELF
ncbi:unnamed protein product [Bursaphelenchus xylophilus]|uniref:diacylglycerol O-acyltransferase n=1 Tax=Bursaphelenchus xylophilus TaxID=6326 RepID=A0A1I7S4G1_BURXY|nr:unnamed protein product [Bursaphelenchus xylophilus]CAG9117055.1 unnamed protein product [Bursaphelenchus xylophilus]